MNNDDKERAKGKQVAGGIVPRCRMMAVANNE